MAEVDEGQTHFYGDGCDAPHGTSCALCGGTGCEEGCGLLGGCEDANVGPDSHKVCRQCGGSGRQG